MTTYFVAYRENQPATVEIKGHRLVFLMGSDEEALESMEELGASNLREVEIDELREDPVAAIAAETNCGVVLAQAGISMSTMLTSLEQELPWVH